MSILQNTKGFRRLRTDFLRTGNYNLTAGYSVDGGTVAYHHINTDTSVKGAIPDYDLFGYELSGHYITNTWGQYLSLQSGLVWNPTFNSPSLTDATGALGQYYFINNTDTRDLGSGTVTWTQNKYIVHDGTKYVQMDTVDQTFKVFNYQHMIKERKVRGT
jgi:hypothetical protein